MSDTSTPSIRPPDTADTLPVDTGEMDCSPLEDDRQGPDADEGGEESGEARASRSVPQPRLPSREERRLHDLTHCPMRPWCKHCVYGAAAEYPHRTVVGEVSKSEVPRVMLDYYIASSRMTLLCQIRGETFLYELLCFAVVHFLFISRIPRGNT